MSWAAFIFLNDMLYYSWNKIQNLLYFLHLNSKKHCKQSIHPDELEFLENIRESNKKIKNREKKAWQKKRNPEKEEILKEAESLQEDTASDSDVSMEDKPGKDDLEEKLDESLLEDSEDDKVKDGKEEIVELPTSCPPDW